MCLLRESVVVGWVRWGVYVCECVCVWEGGEDSMGLDESSREVKTGSDRRIEGMERIERMEGIIERKICDIG